MSQDLSHYTADYYHRDIPETWFWRRGLLRPDQLAALCYTFGVPFWGHDRTAERNPGLVLSVGCGRGELENEIARLGPEVIGYDPSEGAAAMYEGPALVAELSTELVRSAGTVIFCESIEHVPVDEVWHIRENLAHNARLVVVNWPDYHPIEPSSDGWDHITRIDDALFDRLSVGADVVLRRGAHLVLDIRR